MYGNKVFIRGIIRSVNVGYNVRNHKAVKMTVDSVNASIPERIWRR